MLDSLYAKLGGFALLLSLLAGGYAWAHHRGVTDQARADKAIIDRKDAALLAASQSLTGAADALRQINAAAAAQMSVAKASARRAKETMTKAQRNEAAASQRAAAWRVKFRHAVASKPCAAMMEQMLCPDVFESPSLSSSAH
jgi:hypothetical protein